MGEQIAMDGWGSFVEIVLTGLQIPAGFVGGIIEESVIEPIKWLITEKIKDNRVCKQAFKCLEEIKQKFDEQGDKLEIDKVNKKFGEIDKHFTSRINIFARIRSKKNPGEKTAKEIYEEFALDLVNKEAKEIVGKIVRENKIKTWNDNGKYEQIVIRILDIYIQSLPELYFLSLSEEERYKIKIIQNLIETAIKERGGDYAQLRDSIDNLKILLQQHMPFAALTQPVEVKSPFAFIKRVCPECGYDGEYLYYDKANQTVFCSACGKFYDIERDSGKEEEIKKLIDGTKNTILKKMEEHERSSDKLLIESKREIAAVAESTKAVEGKIVETGRDIADLKSIAEDTARRFVLQSKTLKELLSADGEVKQKIEDAANKLNKEFDSLNIKFDKIKDDLKKGTIDVHQAMNDIDARISIMSSTIVTEINEKHEEQMRGHRETQEALKQQGRELKEIKNILNNNQAKSADEVIKELQAFILNRKERASSPQNKMRYFCPECCSIRKKGDKGHSCGDTKLREYKNGHCEGIMDFIKEYIERHKTDLDIYVPANATEFTKHACDVDIGTHDTVIVRFIDNIPDDDGNPGKFDNCKCVVALTNDNDVFKRLKRIHLVGEEKVNKQYPQIFVICKDDVREVKE